MTERGISNPMAEWWTLQSSMTRPFLPQFSKTTTLSSTVESFEASSSDSSGDSVSVAEMRKAVAMAHPDPGWRYKVSQMSNEEIRTQYGLLMGAKRI